MAEQRFQTAKRAMLLAPAAIGLALCVCQAALGQMRPEPPGAFPPGARPSAPTLPTSQPAPLQQPQPNEPEQPVVDVKIAGNKSLPLSKILPHIKTRVGRPFDLEQIGEDVRKLDQTRLFVDVRSYWQQTPNGRIVIFEVIERPLLREVLYVGCKEITKRKLEKETQLKAGDALDTIAIEEARRKIEEYYHKQGYSGARVTLIEGDKPEDRRAIFLINEGVKQSVKWVSFVGNTIADDGRLKTQIKSKPPFLYLFKGELDRKQLDEDVERLTAYYRGLGFFRARIGRELSFNEKQNWVTVTFVIDEGPRYKIRDVSINGNSKYATEELLAELKLRGGEYFNQAKMSADLGALQDKYGGVGYVFADVKADPRFLEEPGQLDLVYNIKEGERYTVGKINVVIKGEYPHTQLTTVWHRLSFKTGDIIDIREIRASERRLRACGLFESNPATGNAPRIVINSPGEHAPEDEHDRRREVAERPSPDGRRKPPDTSGFRGQSPDPPRRDRVLNITLDCGNYVGGSEEADNAVNCGTAVPAAQCRRDACTTNADELSQRLDELTDVLAIAREERLSRERTVPTQYSPDAGKSNPAVSRPWTPTYTSPQSAAPTAPAPTTTNTPTAREPEYVGQRWPRQGPERPVDSPQGKYVTGPIFSESSPFIDGPPDGGDPARPLDVTINAEETMTGRMMFGVGVNSDAGLVGQIVLDEQNFDWTRFPNSWEDFRNGTAFRGAGQRFRLEAVPGTELQRYMITFQDPYFFGTQVSMGLSGYYYNRSYTEWLEQRIGGRFALGYQLTPDLSVGIAYRGAKINITNAIDPTLPEFADVLNRSLALHGFQLSLTHDKRDNAFLATEGHLIEGSIEQVLGSFSYPRAEVDLRKYFTLHERPDGSGRHVLSLSTRAGYTGDNTPIYEHFYAGGFSTIRGFAFRKASPSVFSPVAGQVYIGGEFQLLASAEYLFPITADDMIRGVVFCDTGTVEPTISDWSNKYRIAPGFGLRICVPAMGPAPIALDFAFPVQRQPGDRGEMFSFFVGFGR